MNEIIPLSSSILSGSSEFYVKSYQNITSGSILSGGFFKTYYDGAPTSISASALVDLTYGINTGSNVYIATNTFLKNEKNRVYKQMAKKLLGSEDSIFTFNDIRFNDLFFACLKRRVFKDEVKKGSVTISLFVSGSSNNELILTDTGASSAYTIGPAGDEAPLYSGSTQIGRVYYNAGIVAFSTGVFSPASNTLYWSGSTANNMNLNQVCFTGNIDHMVYGLANRIKLLQFQNQTNLHSTLYFCRALNNEYNYSSNPTFVDADGRIIPTSGSDNQTSTYITTIGLFSINNELLAVAKVSDPIKKNPESELVFRVRLNF